MPKRIHYLSTRNVIVLHATIMTEMGWAPAPLRSEHLLESAVNRPQALGYYGDADIVDLATILAIGISQNQPFLDGNKRTAYAALFTFLEVNDYSLNAESLEIATHLERVAERSGELDAATSDFADWLRDRLTPLDE